MFATRASVALATSLGLSIAFATIAESGCGAARVSFAPDASPSGTSAQSSDAQAADGGIGSLAPLSEAGLLPESFTDFPEPFVDQGAPSGAKALFDAAPPSSGEGPCIYEPEPDVIYPKNWLRPRFAWTPSSGHNLFELRVHIANQTRDLVVYTTSRRWSLPKPIWDSVRIHSTDLPAELIVRSGTLASGRLTGVTLSKQTFSIAPVEAPGSVVYWSTAGDGSLKGFHVGEENVTPVLLPNQIKQARIGSCIGCHAGSPDGEYTVLSSSSTNFGNVIARIDPGDAGVSSIGAMPPFLGAGGKAGLESTPLGMTAFSKAHWAQGDHKLVASDGPNLVVVDLEATSGSGRTVVSTRGNPAAGKLLGAPTWSHDGNTVVYVATNQYTSGRLGTEFSEQGAGALADLYQVPYNGGAGGAASPVSGADDPNILEFYPSFSPDDELLAYVRAPNGTLMYNHPDGEVFTVPSRGGSPVRLRANSPPACTGKRSPGVTNSWPKWAPNVETDKSRKFYWVIFNSARRDPVTLSYSEPQLYISPVIVESNGSISTHGALYLWNQPSGEGNHSPSWSI